MQTEVRKWGYFITLYQTEGCKVKELTLLPGQSISYQRHLHRTEVWYVRKGKGTVWVNTCGTTPWLYRIATLEKDDIHLVPKNYWHKLINDSKEDLVIIEIQYGTKTNEDDIERLDDDDPILLRF